MNGIFRKVAALSIVCAIVLLSGCNFIFGLLPIAGSGHVVTERRNVGSFSRIELRGTGSVRIAQGDVRALTVTVDDNLLSSLNTVVTGDTLAIGFNQPARPTETVIDIVVPEIVSIVNKGVGVIRTSGPILVVDDLFVAQSGVGQIELGSVSVERLRVLVDGTGNVDIQEVIAANVVVNMTGVGSVTIAGSTYSLAIDNDGVGHFDGLDLQSRYCDVFLGGAGFIGANATESVRGELAGLGTIEVAGSPERVSVSITGLGSIDFTE